MDESTGGLITAEMVAKVGAEIATARSYPISASDIRRWAIAVYYPDPPPAMFWDGGPDGDDIVAPEEFNPFAWMAAEPQGVQRSPAELSMEARLGLPELGLPHMLNGGIEVEYGAAMRPGDVIASVTTLDDYSERHGRLGRMLITRSRTEWRNQDDVHVKTQINTLIRYGDT